MYRTFKMVALSFALLVCAPSAWAQTERPERPYRGLFASGTGDAGQLLTANVSFGAGYSNDLIAEATGRRTGVTDPDLASPEGTLGSGSGSLAYTLQAGALSVGMSAGIGVRYYPSNDTFVRSTQGGLDVSYFVEPRTGMRLFASAAVSRRPYLLGALFETFDVPASDAAGPELDLATTDSYVTYQGTAGISQRLSRATTLAASYIHYSARRPVSLGQFERQTALVTLTHNVARGLELQAGYGYNTARFDAGRRIHHIIDAGVNYNRPLSISRRTTLSFATGSTVRQVSDRLRFALTGNVKLNHEIGRSWHASAGYSRRVLMSESWQEPVMADVLSVDFGGLVTRRLQFTSAARATLGKVGAVADSPGFDGYHASAMLRFALTRYSAVGLTYSNHRYRFTEGVLLPSGAVTASNRQTVKAEVSLWAPLFQRTRRENATR